MTWLMCMSICSNVSDKWLFALCQPPEGTQSHPGRETGSPLGQHRAEEIDRGHLGGETQCAVCALQGKVSLQDPHWYLSLCMSSESQPKVLLRAWLTSEAIKPSG